VVGGALAVSLALALILVGLAHVISGGHKAVLGPRSPTVSSAIAAIAPAPTTSATQAPTRGAAVAPSIVVAIAPDAPKPAAVQRGAAPTMPGALAVAHLLAGRYVEARAAYAELCSAHPENLAYQTMSRLLERRTSALCNGPNASFSCPEIVP
jgi:hypothetical protein